MGDPAGLRANAPGPPPVRCAAARAGKPASVHERPGEQHRMTMRRVHVARRTTNARPREAGFAAAQARPPTARDGAHPLGLAMRHEPHEAARGRRPGPDHRAQGAAVFAGPSGCGRPSSDPARYGLLPPMGRTAGRRRLRKEARALFVIHTKPVPALVAATRRRRGTLPPGAREETASALSSHRPSSRVPRRTLGFTTGNDDTVDLPPPPPHRWNDGRSDDRGVSRMWAPAGHGDPDRGAAVRAAFGGVA